MLTIRPPGPRQFQATFSRQQVFHQRQRFALCRRDQRCRYQSTSAHHQCRRGRLRALCRQLGCLCQLSNGVFSCYGKSRLSWPQADDRTATCRRSLPLPTSGERLMLQSSPLCAFRCSPLLLSRHRHTPRSSISSLV